LPSGPSRPSFERIASIPSAAALPTEMPSVFACPLGIAPSDVVNQLSSVAIWAGVSIGEVGDAR
jgi:hypothetical protein